MINREDMLELTRRITPARTSMTKNLKLAKTVRFSDINKTLNKYEFAPKAQKPGGMWQLLMAMKE